MNNKLGVYICGGCSIGDSLDLGQLAAVAQRESKAAVCRTHSFLCGEEGRALLQKISTRVR